MTTSIRRTPTTPDQPSVRSNTDFYTHTDRAGSLSSLAIIEAAEAVQTKRLRLGVVLGEVAIDGRLQVDDRMEAAAADALDASARRRSSRPRSATTRRSA